MSNSFLYSAPDGILAVPANIKIHNTPVHNRRTPLLQTGPFVSPKECIEYNKQHGFPLVTKYTMNNYPRSIQHYFGPSVTCSYHYNADQPLLLSSYRFKFGYETAHLGGFPFTSQSKSVSYTRSKSECFQFCDTDARCIVSSWFHHNRTCMYVPAKAKIDLPLVLGRPRNTASWWIWDVDYTTAVFPHNFHVTDFNHAVHLLRQQNGVPKFYNSGSSAIAYKCYDSALPYVLWTLFIVLCLLAVPFSVRGVRLLRAKYGNDKNQS